MIHEPFTDRERKILLGLCMDAMPRDRAAEPLRVNELTRLIARLSGTDTVIIAHRTYPSTSHIPLRGFF